ncbi:MAG: TRIC cation channel family protein [Oscillospiraceae bacterium]
MELVITILEYVGVFAFAVCGATIAIQEKFDLFGICCVAMVTAMGGGVLRDIVADVGIPLFFQDWTTLPIILCGIILAIYLKNRFQFNRLFVAIDAMGLSAFVVSAGIKAIHNNYSLMLFLFATAITGVGGGILRDIIVNHKPAVFQSDIYTIAGLIGALFLFYTHTYIGLTWASLISLLLIFFIRMICYIKNIHLPIIRYDTEE